MITKFFIHRPIFALVIAIVIILAGTLSFSILPVEQYPDITPPTVSISGSYPGADAETIARTVTTVIEKEVNGVEDMIYMSSQSSADGTISITITFKVGTDIDMATVLVQNRVSIVEPKLPEEVKRQGLTVKKKSTNLTMLVNLTSPNNSYNDVDLSNFATASIKDELTRIVGVGEVSVLDAKNYGMRIWLNPDKLTARNLSTQDILKAIREQNVQVAAGQIGANPAPKGQNFQYTITTKGRLLTVPEFENIIVKVGTDRELVRVKDIARVERGSEKYEMYSQLDSKPACTVGIYQLPGANALQLAEAINAKMEELSGTISELSGSDQSDIKYTIAFDTTKFITVSINEVYETLFIAIILVVLTVYVFMQDFRASLIPAITIPVSLIGTLAVMLLIGFSINTLSLFGIVLVIGIVVDDAIVVVENTMRIIDTEGLSAKEATVKAMQEVTGPVVATTLVLLAVFVPTAVLPGITGQLYKQFSLTIATATIFSSINALTLSPALCGILLRPTSKKQNFFFRGFNFAFDKSTVGFMWVVQRFLRLAVVVLLVFVASLVATGYGFMNLPTGFLPEEDLGYMFVNVQLPDAASNERTREVTDELNKILKDVNGVKHYITIGGFSLLDSSRAPNIASAIVVLEPWEDRTSGELQLQAIVTAINQKLRKIQDASLFVFVPPAIQGLGNAGGFQLEIQDRRAVGLIELQQTAEQISQVASETAVINRANTTFRATVPQLYIDVDRAKVKKLGITLKEVFDTLQANLGSAYVNDYDEAGNIFKVMTQAEQEYRNKKDDILKLKVRNAKGQMIPMRTFASVKDTAGPQTIMRYNVYPSATITGNPAAGFSSGQAVSMMEQISKTNLPSGMQFEWTGMTYQQIEAGSMAIYIFSLSIILVYLFLAAQYESWSIPLAVVFSVPLAVAGAVLATMLRGLDNNIYTQIGLVLLIALACKNAILIVEFAKQSRESGMSIYDATVHAARLRFRPILMTAISFILGVIPLVIATGAGAAARQALGTVVFGGMLAATMLGVFLVPVLYFSFQHISEFLFGAPEVIQPSTDQTTAHESAD